MDKLKIRKVKGKIKTLKAIPYKGCMVYLRHIPDLNIFEYLLVFNNQIYSSYVIMEPGIGKKTLSRDEINQSAALVFAQATTTVDTLLERDTMEKGNNDLHEEVKINSKEEIKGIN